MRTEPLRIFLSTGEVSGDVVGAQLAARILEERPETSLYGVGGSRMEAAGVSIDFDTNHLGTVGVSEAFSKLPAHWRALGRIRARVRRDRPDVAVLIGNDVFNVLLGRWLRSRGVTTISYFPPQVWIWGAIARFVSKSFDLILSSFPDEHRVYGATPVRTLFVGHYLCDRLSAVTEEERSASRGRMGLPAGATVLGVLPGSRAHEIDSLAGALLDSVAALRRRQPDLRFLLPLAEPLYGDRIRDELRRRGLADRVEVVEGSHDVMRASDLLLTASGTATLEAALLGIPMVVVYRVAWLTQFVVRTAIRLGLMQSETLALPNLVLGEATVPEFSQRAMNAAAIEHEAWDLVSRPERRLAMRTALAGVRERLAAADTLGQVARTIVAQASAAAARRTAAIGLFPVGAAASDPLKDGG